MYKLIILAICFATTSLFSVSTAFASESLQVRFENTNKGFHFNTLDNPLMKVCLNYLISKKVQIQMVKELKLMQTCEECEISAQVAANKTFQSVYTATGDLEKAARDSGFVHDFVWLNCALTCDEPGLGQP